MAFKVKFAILTSFVILFAVLYYNAFILNQPCRHKLNPIKESDKIQLSEEIKTRLQNALSIRTISGQENQNTSANIDYINFIRKEFAKIEKHPYVKLTLINKYSMLYKIDGKDTSLKPYLLAAHYDVVPVNEDEWSYSPFGESRDGFIYGRGTMDDKGSMIAQLEAVQSFLEKHGQPKRTIYLAYGHDEEVTGYAGAGEIAKYLGNIQLEYVIDEGTLIIEDLFPELGKPVALVSIADKGYLTLKFSVNVVGGHSSMPDTKNSAIFILAEAITRLKNNKFPSLLGQGPELLLLKRLGSNMGFFKRLLLSNVWFFKPLIDMIFSQQPSTDSVLRTTTSVNIFKSGVKENVLPSYGEFYVNHRIHPSQTCQEVIDYDLKVINDPQIKLEVVQCVEPSPVSSTESLGYMIIDHSTREVYNDLHVLPSVMVGLTDSRFYYNNTKDIYKYLPAKTINADLKGYHGANERLSWESYKEMINFYFVLIRNTEDSHLIKDKFKDEL